MATNNQSNSNKETFARNDDVPRDANGLRMTVHREGTKTAIAYKVWDDLHESNPKASRKECIEQAQREADMTPASANTFYQQWRSERGMVNEPEFDQRTENTGQGGSGTGERGEGTMTSTRPANQGGNRGSGNNGNHSRRPATAAKR